MMVTKHGARKGFAALALVPALALALTACGSAAKQTTQTAGTPKALPLNVSLGAASVGYAAFFLAEAQGLFAKHGVDVNVVSYMGTPVAGAELVSGQVDIAISNPSVAATLMRQQPAVVTMWLFSQTYHTYGVVGAKGESIDTLRAKGSKCRIATGNAGSFQLGWTKQFMTANHLDCSIIQQATLPAIDATVSTGAADAAVTAAADAATLVSAGKAVYLYDPSTVSQAEGLKVSPEPIPVLLAIGMKKNLEGKRDAVTRFLAALREALLEIPSLTPEQLTQEVIKDRKAWAAVPVASVLASAKLYRTSYPVEEQGQISKDTWTRALSYIRLSGIEDIDPNDPSLAYDKVVDMTYLDAASKG